jgi:tRNA (cytidine56-2'-O)-methyltransferase
LTARALGAKGMYLAAADKGVVESIHDVVDRWGGNFFCKDTVKWRSCIRDWKSHGGIVVHLTMYGLNLPDVIGEIRTHEKILVIVGAEKVPGEIYGLSDYNVAVTGQPHSEISSLALFLDHYFSGQEFGNEFTGAKIRIIPSKSGKKTEEM